MWDKDLWLLAVEPCRAIFDCWHSWIQTQHRTNIDCLSLCLCSVVYSGGPGIVHVGVASPLSTVKQDQKIESINSNWIIDSRCGAEKSWLDDDAQVFLTVQCSWPAFEGRKKLFDVLFTPAIGSMKSNEKKFFRCLLLKRPTVPRYTHVVVHRIATAAIIISIASSNGYQFSLKLVPPKGAF